MADENASALMELAAKADNDGLNVDLGGSPEVKAPDVEASKNDEKTGDKSAGNDDAASASHAEAGAKEGKEDDSKAQPTKTQAQSKFAKERERKERTWQEINSEKESIKAERERIAAEKSEIEKHRRELEEKTKASERKSARDEKGFSADDYEAAAKRFQEDGDLDMANAARERAKQLRDKAVLAEFGEKWTANYNGLVKEHPDLKDQNSELFKDVKAFLDKYELLKQVPDGLKYAVRAVTLESGSRDREKLAAENKQLKKQLDELNKKLGIGGGEILARGNDSDIPFDKMSPEQQRNYLMRSAKEADDRI